MPGFYPLPGDFSPIGRFQRLVLLNEAAAFNVYTKDAGDATTSYSPYQVMPGTARCVGKPLHSVRTLGSSCLPVAWPPQPAQAEST